MIKKLLQETFGIIGGGIIWSIIIGLVIGGLFIWSLAYYFPCAIGKILPNIACAC